MSGEVAKKVCMLRVGNTIHTKLMDLKDYRKDPNIDVTLTHVMKIFNGGSRIALQVGTITVWASS